MIKGAHITDGSTLYATVKQVTEQAWEHPKSFRYLACHSAGIFSLVYAMCVRADLGSIGIDVPDDLNDAQLIKWAIGLGHLDNVTTRRIQSLCHQWMLEADKEENGLGVMLWRKGAQPQWATQPEFISPCRRCRCLFFHSDSRRTICNGCHRKIERDKKRGQRGTDLSERICEVCGTAFTPKRSHAKVCSPKCRAKLSRQKR